MTPEYAKRVFEPLDKYHHGDLSLNDYRGEGDSLTEYPSPAMSSEELREFILEKEQDAQNDLIPW